MKVMTPRELADGWEIEEDEVMIKIHNTLAPGGNATTNKLPEAFMVRKYPDSYRIIVPQGYQFHPVNPKKPRRRKR